MTDGEKPSERAHEFGYTIADVASLAHAASTVALAAEAPQLWIFERHFSCDSFLDCNAYPATHMSIDEAMESRFWERVDVAVFGGAPPSGGVQLRRGGTGIPAGTEAAQNALAVVLEIRPDSDATTGAGTLRLRADGAEEQVDPEALQAGLSSRLLGQKFGAPAAADLVRYEVRAAVSGQLVSRVMCTRLRSELHAEGDARVAALEAENARLRDDLHEAEKGALRLKVAEREKEVAERERDVDRLRFDADRRSLEEALSERNVALARAEARLAAAQQTIQVLQSRLAQSEKASRTAEKNAECCAGCAPVDSSAQNGAAIDTKASKEPPRGRYVVLSGDEVRAWVEDLSHITKAAPATNTQPKSRAQSEEGTASVLPRSLPRSLPRTVPSSAPELINASESDASEEYVPHPQNR